MIEYALSAATVGYFTPIAAAWYVTNAVVSTSGNLRRPRQGRRQKQSRRDSGKKAAGSDFDG